MCLILWFRICWSPTGDNDFQVSGKESTGNGFISVRYYEIVTLQDFIF